MNEDLQRLKEALTAYKNKWESEKEQLSDDAENVRMHVKLNAMCYLSQWIINSINGGISKNHATNICKILDK